MLMLQNLQQRAQPPRVSPSPWQMHLPVCGMTLSRAGLLIIINISLPIKIKRRRATSRKLPGPGAGTCITCRITQSIPLPAASSCISLSQISELHSRCWCNKLLHASMVLFQFACSECRVILVLWVSCTADTKSWQTCWCAKHVVCAALKEQTTTSWCKLRRVRGVRHKHWRTMTSFVWMLAWCWTGRIPVLCLET